MNTRTETYAFAPRGDKSLTEYHIVISVTEPSLGWESQLEAVLHACGKASEGRTVHFRRFFLSDAANQYPSLSKALAGHTPIPTSVVQQAPLDGTRIAAWMYCTAPIDSSRGVPSHNGYSHHWSGSMTSPGADSYAQMQGIFSCLDSSLQAKGLSIAANTLRTWIFVRDVDSAYAGVVNGRKDYFESIGLTDDTHFIASTGIEGRTPDPQDAVEMDAYSVDGLKDGQVTYLHAGDHLNRTSEYGVTFERGTAVIYGDRRHVFISGTASIDSRGEVLHQGDAGAQASRMLENVEALLSEAGADFGDVAMAIVYLRDRADYPRVREIVSRACPSRCIAYVLAPVCRPAWLVEMECIAITAAGNSEFRPL